MEDVEATPAAAAASGATGRAILRVLIVMALLLGQLVIRARAKLRRAERARTGRSRASVARTRCGNTPNAAPCAAADGCPTSARRGFPRVGTDARCAAARALALCARRQLAASRLPPWPARV